MNGVHPHAWLAGTLVAIVKGDKQSQFDELVPWPRHGVIRTPLTPVRHLPANGARFDVFTTALPTLPGAVVLTATCVGTARIVEWMGRETALVVVHMLISAGIFMLLLTRAEATAVAFIASIMIAGIGYGLSCSLVAEVGVSAVPAELARAAGPIADTSNELGNALGITLLGSLAALRFHLPGPGVAGTLNKTLDHAGITQEVAALRRNPSPFRSCGNAS